MVGLEQAFAAGTKKRRPGDSEGKKWSTPTCSGAVLSVALSTQQSAAGQPAALLFCPREARSKSLKNLQPKAFRQVRE